MMDDGLIVPCADALRHHSFAMACSRMPRCNGATQAWRSVSETCWQSFGQAVGLLEKAALDLLTLTYIDMCTGRRTRAALDLLALTHIDMCTGRRTRTPVPWPLLLMMTTKTSMLLRCRIYDARPCFRADSALRQ